MFGILISRIHFSIYIKKYFRQSNKAFSKTKAISACAPSNNVRYVLSHSNILNKMFCTYNLYVNRIWMPGGNKGTWEDTTIQHWLVWWMIKFNSPKGTFWIIHFPLKLNLITVCLFLIWFRGPSISTDHNTQFFN